MEICLIVESSTYHQSRSVSELRGLGNGTLDHDLLAMIMSNVAEPSRNCEWDI
jgi:hypothetical protein